MTSYLVLCDSVLKKQEIAYNSWSLTMENKKRTEDVLNLLAQVKTGDGFLLEMLFDQNNGAIDIEKAVELIQKNPCFVCNED